MYENFYNLSSISNSSKNKAWRAKIKRIIITIIKISTFSSIIIIKAIKNRKKTSKENAIQEQNDGDSTKLIVR